MPGWRWRRTTRWRSICTWPRLTRPSRGWNTSNGSTRFSTSAWRFAPAESGCPTEPWVEHFEWLNPLFNERMEIRDGRIWVPDRPGLGFTLSDQMRALTKETAKFGAAWPRHWGSA